MLRTLRPMVLAATLVLAACGGSDGATSAGASESDDPETTASDEPADEPGGEAAQAGPFDIEGSTAFMVDEIDSDTPDAVRTVLDEYPEVTTISLVNVGGSSNDQANLEASRLVRRAGLATHVPADGEIASGGVDFFLAGATRSYDDGARFGVHSWAGDGIEGADLPDDDPEHDLIAGLLVGMGLIVLSRRRSDVALEPTSETWAPTPAAWPTSPPGMPVAPPPAPGTPVTGPPNGFPTPSATGVGGPPPPPASWAPPPPSGPAAGVAPGPAAPTDSAWTNPADLPVAPPSSAPTDGSTGDGQRSPWAPPES